MNGMIWYCLKWGKHLLKDNFIISSAFFLYKNQIRGKFNVHRNYRSYYGKVGYMYKWLYHGCPHGRFFSSSKFSFFFFKYILLFRIENPIQKCTRLSRNLKKTHKCTHGFWIWAKHNMESLQNTKCCIRL